MYNRPGDTFKLLEHLGSGQWYRCRLVETKASTVAKVAGMVTIH